MIAGAVTGKGEVVVEWSGWSLEIAADAKAAHFCNAIRHLNWNVEYLPLKLGKSKAYFSTFPAYM